jgi:hypothetical protein
MLSKPQNIFIFLLTLFYFLVILQTSPALAAPPVNPLTSQCPEGQFLSIKDNQCVNLVTNYGFKESDFPALNSLPTITGDTVAKIKNLAAAGNARIVIPAGSYTISEIRPGNNVVIEGEGADKTILNCNYRYAFEIIGNQSNIIIRNLAIIGDVNNCFEGVYANSTGSNILVERIKSVNMRVTSIGGNIGRNFTARYNWVEGTRDWHGIGVDDGYSNVSIYSNYITNIGFNNSSGSSYPLNSHASQVEIAGNYSENTRSMMKTPDGIDVLVHKNYFGPAWDNFKYVWSYKDLKNCPENHIYADNVLNLSGDEPFKFYDSQNIYLNNNSFLGTYIHNVGGRVRECPRGPVYACPGTPDANLSGVSIAPIDASVTFSGIGAILPCALTGGVVNATPPAGAAPTNTPAGQPGEFMEALPTGPIQTIDSCGKDVKSNSQPTDYSECVECIKKTNFKWTGFGCIPTKPADFTQSALNILTSLVGGISFVALLYGGGTILASKGSPEQIEAGKDIVLKALIGVIITIFSVFILRFLGVEILTLPGFG